MSTTSNIPAILCVEDHDQVAGVLSSLLSNLPARVDVAANGDDAIRLILRKTDEKSAYDLIILDRRVPRSAGEPVDIDFASTAQSTIRSLFGLIPIIVFTNYPSYENCIDAIRAGAIDYIPKTDPNSSSINFERLFESCKRLFCPATTTSIDPIGTWFQENLTTLIAKFPGKVAAVIEPEYARRVKVGEAIGGYAVIPGDSLAEVRSIIFHNQLSGWAKTRLIEIPNSIGE
ncbi:MAG TPA: response regulator [Gemmataceae bacterium]|jgi:CheY-like chemotaxis protein|nr:response regulator [Gemmataceae bacterium]